ncbi:Exopolyphosphatase [Coemansia sp. RSA 552]|nr:Exopolyphosphatase [Coemansia sp. RSA 552]
MRGFGAFAAGLASGRARLNSTAAKGLTLVLGNESADLDSVVSSIALAYSLSRGEEWAVPVINTNRADMALRPDSELLLRSVLPGGGMEDLAFIDDVDMAALLDRVGLSGLAIWLADHNAPASRQAVLEPFVRGIVDHHADEGKCRGAEWRQIEKVGSCATLVAERIRGMQQGSLEPELAKMLLAPILIDTSNLDPKAQRATEKDIECVRWLEPQVNWAAASAGVTTGDDAEPSLDVGSSDALYRTLDKVKGRVSHYPSRDLLRKDYKQWEVAVGGGRPWTVGISSISYRLRKWLKRDGRQEVERAVIGWVAERKLDVALVMTHGKAKEAKGGSKVYGRDLTVAFGDGVPLEMRRLVVEGLLGSDQLGLRGYFGADDGGGGGRIHFYTQTRTESSRKQVFPVVKSVVESLGE